MTKTEVRVTSGAMRSLNENTRPQKTDSGSWSARSVTVTVSSSSRSERISSLNERLRGNSNRTYVTSK